MTSLTETYDSWKQCLSRNMAQELTLGFVNERVSTLGNKGHPETKKYIQAYGNERHGLVLGWFKQLEQEMKNQ